MDPTNPMPWLNAARTYYVAKWSLLWK